MRMSEERLWRRQQHSQPVEKKLLQHFKQVNADKFQYIDNVMNVLDCVNVDQYYQSIAANRIQQLSYCFHT